MADEPFSPAQSPPRERELLTNLLENIPDRIYFKDLRSRLIAVNRAWASMFGIDDPSAVQGKTDFDFFDANHARDAMADERKVIETGKPVISKIEQMVLPGGKRAWALTTKM